MSTEALTVAEPAIDPSFENVWDELVWRGLVHVSTDQQALRDLLAGDPITYYCGFDQIGRASCRERVLVTV